MQLDRGMSERMGPRIITKTGFKSTCHRGWTRPLFSGENPNDLLALRSDLYRLNEAKVLEPTVDAPTAIDLDPEHYKKMMGEFERLVKGAPSQRECSRLTVMVPVIFTEDDKLKERLRFRIRTPPLGA